MKYFFLAYISHILQNNLPDTSPRVPHDIIMDPVETVKKSKLISLAVIVALHTVPVSVAGIFSTQDLLQHQSYKQTFILIKI